MSGTSAISQAIAKANGTTKTVQKDTLERQVEAAEFYGAIKADNEQQLPKKRGRPPTKSKSPGPSSTSTQPKSPSSTKKNKDSISDEGVDNIVNEMKKSRLIAKLRACCIWWPELCNETLRNTNIYLLSTEQLEKICKGFEDSVMIQSEIVDIPKAFKQTISKIEPFAITIGTENQNHPILGHFTKLRGFSLALQRDASVDRNVKLLSLRFLGRMPRSPFLSLLWSILMVGIEVIKDNTMAEIVERVPETGEYEGL